MRETKSKSIEQKNHPELNEPELTWFDKVICNFLFLKIKLSSINKSCQIHDINSDNSFSIRY